MAKKETVQKEISPIEAYMQNLAVINTVVEEMREIPVLPSEVPKDSNPLVKVEFPKEGGVLTYMENYPLPYRGFPMADFVDKIDIVKKISRAILSGLYHELKGRNKLVLATLLPALWLSRPMLRIAVYTFYRVVERFRIKKERYSQPIRELHRVFSIPGGKEPKNMVELRLRIRDLLCMILEFDNAYRFRMQDVLIELDKDNLKKDTAEELIRLLAIMQSREKGQDIKDTWTLLKLFFKFYLRVDKKVRLLIIDVLSNINMKEIELSNEDIQYCEPRKDYTFGFQLVKGYVKPKQKKK